MPIALRQIKYEYNKGTPFSYLALDGIDLTIQKEKVTAIIGQTGSGKSTLIQHLNALLLPNEGSVVIDEITIQANEKPKQWKELRKRVGLVFQFPEYQLFEETIEKDIAFGPKNIGMAEEEIQQQVKRIIKLVGLDESFLEKSPFELSGGQKRRVAIAGILAMDPDVIVLDEPTAGLDPQGAKEMMQLFIDYNKQFHKTIILVTHDMEHVLNYCDHVVVVDQGKIKKDIDKTAFFKDGKLLKDLNIKAPAMIELQEKLKEKGWAIEENILVFDDLVEKILKEVSQDE